MLSSKDELVINRQYCPVCKSVNTEVLFNARHNSAEFIDFLKLEKYYSKGFYEGFTNGPLGELVYEIAECNDCHFIYLTEVLSDKGMDLLYNEWLDKELLREHYSNIKHSAHEESMLRVIKNHFRKASPLNLMDFGAGYGNFCSMAVKLGFHTYAFDLSADKNDRMDSMGVIIINDLDEHSNHFDFIFVNQVLEHLSDPVAVLKRLQKCLSNKGLMYVAVPDCENVKIILKEQGLSEKLFMYLSPHQHINAFTNSTLKVLAANAGLKPLSMFDYLGLFSAPIRLQDFIFLVKKSIKNSKYSTGLFFKRSNAGSYE